MNAPDGLDLLKVLVDAGSTGVLCFVVIRVMQSTMTTISTMHSDVLAELRGMRADVAVLLDRRSRPGAA